MEKKELVIIIIAVVIVAVAAAWILIAQHGAVPGAGQGGGGPQAGAPAIATRTAVPANVTVPTAEATGSVAANVAVPTTVAPANPTDSASYRNFAITIANDAFSPSEIVVYAGDTVSVSFTAVDKAYDFTLPDYGMKVPIPQGSTRQIQLSPHATGTFLFYCTSCGGPARGPTGHLVVVSPAQ
jgi:heme/copper-type cytochrome/quinol oxidase subunit 2